MENGVGPVDQALSGAGMAYPQEAAAALNWNPASISSFQRSELTINLQMMQPTTTVNSSVNENTFGPGFPPVNMAGETSSGAGPFPIPSLAYVNAKKDRSWSIGIGALGVGGFGVDYEMDPTNPILTPQPPNGMGFGASDSEFSLLQVVPTVAYKFNENWSVGLAPTFSLAQLTCSPFPAAPPGPSGYPSTDTESATGWGFQAGIQGADLNGFHVAASFKSPQKFSAFQYTGKEDGQEFEFQLDYPMIISGGAAYSGVDKLVLMGDVRYIDYANATGFDDSGYNADGSVKGFGWESIVVVALGAQYNITPKLPLRIGYSFNDNPISNELSFFNMPAPGIIQQRVSGGLSYLFSPAVTASFMVQYGLENSVEGPWLLPMAPAEGMPGTSITSTMSTLLIGGGVQIGF